MVEMLEEINLKIISYQKKAFDFYFSIVYTCNMNHSYKEDLSPEETEFGIWLENGIERGWVTPPYCNTHDGGYEYMGEEEQEEWEAGGDPCCHVIRLMIS